MEFPKLSELRSLRERLHWSQAELASRAEVSQSSIPKYESGSQIPSYEVATRLFKVLLEEVLSMDLKVSEIMETNLIKTKSSTRLVDVVRLMKENSISQLPVVKEKTVVGTISEGLILDLLNGYQDMNVLKEQIVTEVMGEPLPAVPSSARIKEVTALLRHYGAILVLDQGKLVGIISKADLLDL